MLLHHDRELFQEVINSASTDLGLPIAVVEKENMEIVKEFDLFPFNMKVRVSSVP